jgi:serine O-acetyltransferase
LAAHRVANRWWVRGHRHTARVVATIARTATGVEIHPAATIGRRCIIDHGHGTVIGESAELGDDVLAYQGVTLGGTVLGNAKRHPTIGNGVLLGAGTKILDAISVGDGARIGANAVVVRDVPSGATVTAPHSVQRLPAQPKG